MDNRARGIRILAVMAAAALLLLAGACAALAEDDPIRVSSRCEPQSVVSEQDVTVTIKIYNSSQTDMTEDITLFDPSAVSVEKYLGGLKAEQSVTYTGTWHVTQEQIDEGRIEYYIRYYIDSADGPQQKVSTIPVSIQTAAAAPQLTATYTVSPAAARRGQQVTLSYTLSNTGNVELRDISVVNEGVSDRELTAASLSVGEKVTLSDTFTMGDEEVVSHPTVTYRASDSNTEMTIDDMARRTITVAEDGLEAEIAMEPSENVYPGETVELTLTMKNSGESAYSGLSAVMPDGTVLAQGVSLAPGASHETTIAWTPQEAGAVAAEITGLDAEGEAVAVSSNAVELTLQDASTALVLRVRAQAQETTIYSEPAVVRFGIVVENIGQTDATTLTIAEAGTTVATIPSLPSGESRTVVLDLQTSIAGQIQFTVTGKDALGNDRSYTSNIIQLVYMAPTPTPTAAPTPTPVPPTPSPVPTATPAPTLGEILAEHVDLRVLYTVAGLLGAALVAIASVSALSAARRKKRMAGALDTIELTPDVRDHRGKRRGGKRDKRARKGADDSQQEELEEGETGLPEQIVPTPELTAEDTMRRANPAQDAPVKKDDAAPASAVRRPQAEVDVPADETLRVAPVGERPDFVAQGKVDDSQTRVFTRIRTRAALHEAAEQPDEPKPQTAQKTPAPKPQGAPEEITPQGDKLDQTIRFDRTQLDQARDGQRRDHYENTGKRRSEIKPMKKKLPLFGRKRDEDEFTEDLSNDLFGEGDVDDEDDDLFE